MVHEHETRTIAKGGDGLHRPTTRRGSWPALGAAVLGVAHVVAACGASTAGGDPTMPPAAIATVAPTGVATTVAPPNEDGVLLADAPASGVVIELVAQKLPGKEHSFDLVEMAVPAEMSFEVALENQDELAKHDFAIVPEGLYASNIFFQSRILDFGESELIAVPGLRAGTYEFICSLHSIGMRGLLVVR